MVTFESVLACFILLLIYSMFFRWLGVEMFHEDLLTLVMLRISELEIKINNSRDRGADHRLLVKTYELNLELRIRLMAYFAAR